MAFYIDDVPSDAFVIEPPDTIDLAGFTGAEAEMIDPTGTVTELTATIAPDDLSVVVAIPATSMFTEEGVHRLRVALTDAPARQRLPEVRIVVQDPESEWHTLDSIRDEWPDAERLDDVTLWNMLQVVREQVIEFAPTLAEDAPVPENYRLGQRMQVRNTYNAARVAPDGGTGEGDFIIRPFPLDWHVKHILRPKSGKPVVA